MKLTFLGTGTSYGVPYIGCDCAVCRSDDPFNKRLRASVLVEAAEGDGAVTRILVDTTPDLRQQFLRADIRELSAILWTHSHNDHIIGLDDLRPITDRCGYLDGYANQETLDHLQRVFDYIFVQGREHGGFPRVTPHLLEPGQAIPLGPIRATAIPIMHGRRSIYAYRFEDGARSLVYATDCSAIPEASWELMSGADVLVLDALRYKEHPTHFSVEQALEAVSRLRPGCTLFTHAAHDLDHRRANFELPSGVAFAYDGMTVRI